MVSYVGLGDWIGGLVDLGWLWALVFELSKVIRLKSCWLGLKGIWVLNSGLKRGKVTRLLGSGVQDSFQLKCSWVRIGFGSDWTRPKMKVDLSKDQNKKKKN